MVSSSIDDIRFTVQRGYLSEEFRDRLRGLSLNITNNVIVIPGDALLAENDTDVDSFINAKQRKISEALECYLFRNKVIPIKYNSPEEIEDLVVINIEAKDRISYAPNNLHKWKDSDYWEGIIEGYKRRIAATRALMPNAKISLFQVVRPLDKGINDTDGNLCIFRLRVSALIAAGENGMFDDLDYLSPPCYLRLDALQDELNDLALTQGIESSLAIRNSRGEQLPLAPFTSFWIFNDQPYPAANPCSVRDQLDIMQRYPKIEIVVFWSGRENIQTAKYQDLDFLDFFTQVFS